MHVKEHFPTSDEILDIPIANFIILSVNSCGYSGKSEELIVNSVYPVFLKAKASESIKDNLNWCETINGQFPNKYLDAMRVKITTLESIGDWGVFDQKYYMNIIQLIWALNFKRYPSVLIKWSIARFMLVVVSSWKDSISSKNYTRVVQWTAI